MSVPRVSAANVIAGLPPLEWRNLEAPPYDVLGVSWQHEQAPRGVPYVNSKIHDWTGRDAFEFTARLFFLNTLIDERQLFPDAWEDGGWREALLDGSAGPLQHPLLGTVRARVLSAKTEIASRVRSGIIVDVTWVEDLDDPAEAPGLDTPTVDPVKLAQAADTSAAAFGVTYPTGKAQTSLLGAFNAIRSALFAVDRLAIGALNQLMGIVEQMTDALEVLNDAQTWPAINALVAFWNSLKDLSVTVGAANRPTARRVVREDTTLDAFAASVGNSLKDIMGLNLNALRLPLVPRGTTLVFYTEK